MDIMLDKCGGKVNGKEKGDKEERSAPESSKAVISNRPLQLQVVMALRKRTRRPSLHSLGSLGPYSV